MFVDGAIDWLMRLGHWVMAFTWWIWDAHFPWLVLTFALVTCVMAYSVRGFT